MPDELEAKGYLFFLLATFLICIAVLSAVYLWAVIEIAMFVFSVLSMGVGYG